LAVLANFCFIGERPTFAFSLLRSV
jgi:hypothetical protein